MQAAHYFFEDPYRVKKLKLVLLAFILIFFTYGYQFLHVAIREEDCYIVCEMRQQDLQGYTQIALPDGETVWIEIEDEVVSQDGKYVVLRVVRKFNRLNQLCGQYIMDTAIYNKQE